MVRHLLLNTIPSIDLLVALIKNSSGNDIILTFNVIYQDTIQQFY
jgi:hypothetical protein